MMLLPAYKYLNPRLYALPTLSVSSQTPLKFHEENSLQVLEGIFCSAVNNHSRVNFTFGIQIDIHLQNGFRAIIRQQHNTLSVACRYYVAQTFLIVHSVSVKLVSSSFLSITSKTDHWRCDKSEILFSSDFFLSIKSKSSPMLRKKSKQQYIKQMCNCFQSQ